VYILRLRYGEVKQGEDLLSRQQHIQVCNGEESFGLSGKFCSPRHIDAS
jgi:hypothetical protein